jgi:hypothetical protein
MWTWVAKNRAEGDRILSEILVPLLNRDRDVRCKAPSVAVEYGWKVLSRDADAGCQRVYLWPLGDELRQIELMANEVTPRIELR